jgi:hypothetical protein
MTGNGVMLMSGLHEWLTIENQLAVSTTSIVLRLKKHTAI